MESREWDQVHRDLVQIHIERALKSGGTGEKHPIITVYTQSTRTPLNSELIISLSLSQCS